MAVLRNSINLNRYVEGDSVGGRRDAFERCRYNNEDDDYDDDDTMVSGQRRI